MKFVLIGLMMLMMPRLLFGTTATFTATPTYTRTATFTLTKTPTITATPTITLTPITSENYNYPIIKRKPVFEHFRDMETGRGFN